MDPLIWPNKAGWPARTYIQQLCEDTWCSPGDLPKAINDKEEWRERVRDIRAGGTTWWWWLEEIQLFPDVVSLSLEISMQLFFFPFIFPCYRSSFDHHGVVYYLVLLLITVTQLHIQIQADSFVSETNGFINSWLRSMAIRGESHNS